jgi:hypothetical protein
MGCQRVSGNESPQDLQPTSVTRKKIRFPNSKCSGNECDLQMVRQLRRSGKQANTHLPEEIKIMGWEIARRNWGR